MAEAAKKPEEEKLTAVLMPKRIGLAEHIREYWVVTVEENVTRKDLMNPAFWAHASQVLKPYNRIEVRHDAGQFFAELLVLSVGRGYAKVFELSFHELDKSLTPEMQSPDYEIAWKGPALKYCVVRKSDSERIKDGMGKEEAHIWLRDYLQTVA